MATLSAFGGETASKDLVIPVAELSGQARYYPVTIEGYRMQLFALVAPDKTVRVVFDACQSCGPAGFRQEKNSMVCTACKQGFEATVLEQQRGGCNPIPVGEKNRIRDPQGNIIVQYAFLKQAKDYFAQRWAQ